MPSLRPIDDVRPTPDAGSISDREGVAMARAAIRLFERWGITDLQATVLLGELTPRTYTRWKAGNIGRLSRDLKTRLSNLMGIHKALRIIFNDDRRVYGWVSRSNEAFGGRSALEVMLDGELTDLMRVRQYLDAERGGW